jgi:hypothetical protein
MKIEDWTLILSAVQTIAIVLSFAALIWQLRQVNSSLQQDAYSKAIEDYSQMMNHLLQKPNLNRFFYEGIAEFESLSDDEKDFYNYMALSFALFERIYLLANKGAVESGIWSSWERWLADAWFRPKLFEIFWKNERTFFTADFCKLVDTKFTEYKSANQIDNE